MTDLTWAISSCVLILAVIVIRAAFGKRMRPGLRYALWGLALLRLLYPGTVLSSPVSVQGAAEQSEVVRNFEVLRGVDTITYMDMDSSDGAGYIVCPKRDGLSLERGTPERFERMQATLKVRDVLNPIWFTGIAITSAVFLASNLRFYAQLRKRRRTLETDCPLRVYAVENLSSSCLFGNAIYVAAETAADETKLRHVLAHELSHHRHGDHVWALLRCAALAIHWYNPLVWRAAALSRQDSELCADAGAVKRLGEAERENYGATLIELSARRGEKASLLCAATTMTNGKKSLKERVTMIARRPRMTAAVVIAVVLIAAVAAGCAFAGAAWRENEATTDEAQPETQTEAIHTVETPDEWAAQLDLISASCDTWKAESEQDAWASAAVALDQNGRLEIIATENHGTGHYNTTRVWEVSATFDALAACPMEEAAPATLEPNYYYDAERGIPQVYEAWYAPYNGRIFYIVDDGYNDATYSRSFIRSIWLEDGKFGGIELASMETDYMLMSERDPTTHLSYFDRQGGAITAEEYEAIGEVSYGQDCVPYRMRISWIVDTTVQEMSEADTLRGALEDSFNGFALVPLSASGNLDYNDEAQPETEQSAFRFYGDGWYLDAPYTLGEGENAVELAHTVRETTGGLFYVFRVGEDAALSVQWEDNTSDAWFHPDYSIQGEGITGFTMDYERRVISYESNGELTERYYVDEPGGGCYEISLGGTKYRDELRAMAESFTIDPSAKMVFANSETLRGLLAQLSPADVRFNFYDDEGLQGSAGGASAPLAADYLAAFAAFEWIDADPLDEAARADGWRIELDAPGWQLTDYQSWGRVLVETSGGELWLTGRTVPDMQYSWMSFDTLEIWYRDALTAETHHGSGTPLDSLQLQFWHTELATERNGTLNIISCFFTSYYDDVRDLDLGEFLAYCPLSQSVEDETEFDALHVDWEIGEEGNRHNVTLHEMPVPTHRYRVADINGALEQYAGVTLDDLNTDWRHNDRMLYVPEYDAFYNFTSDFGPGQFFPRYGERNGDIVTLWSDDSVLRLRLTNDWFHILSHLPDDLA